MYRTHVSSLVALGILAAAGCGGPGPTEQGGGYQLPPDAKKAQEEAAKENPEQTMEKMMKSGKSGDPTKK